MGSVVVNADDTEERVGPEVMKVGSETCGLLLLLEDIGVGVEGCIEEGKGGGPTGSGEGLDGVAHGCWVQAISSMPG